MSCCAEQKQNRELRNRSCVARKVGRGIRNPNAEFAGGIDVDIFIPVAGRLNEHELGLDEKQLAPDMTHGEKHIEIERGSVVAFEPLNHFMVRQRCSKVSQDLRCKEVPCMEKSDLHVYPSGLSCRMLVDA
jgi:hypothetical protein